MPAGRTGGGKGQKRGREAAGLEEDFLEMCEEEAEKRAAGERRWVAHEVVEEGLARKGHAKEAIAQVLNKLLKARKVQIFNHKGDLYYMVTPKEHAEQFQDLGSEELLVYQNIKEAGNLGIWTRDLKQQSNLQQPQINKILKTLESRQIIKSVKSVQNKNRKVYMLFELEPSKEITGGPGTRTRSLTESSSRSCRRSASSSSRRRRSGTAARRSASARSRSTSRTRACPTSSCQRRRSRPSSRRSCTAGSSRARPGRRGSQRRTSTRSTPCRSPRTPC